MSSFCVTCLSRERNLTSVKNLNVCIKVWRDVKINTSEKICWECKAIFVKIWKFKQQVLEAQSVLKDKKMKKLLPNLKCLSKLSMVKYCTIDSDLVLDTEVPSKIEPVQFDQGLLPDIIEMPLEDTKKIMVKIERQDCEGNDFDFDTTMDMDNSVKQEEEWPVETKSGNINSNNGGRKFIASTMTEEELKRTRECDMNRARYKRCEFRCEKCILGYFSKEQYQRHIVDRHSKDIGEFMCKICESHFPDARSCDLHLKRHYVCYQCPECAFRGHKMSVMVLHYSKEHETHRKYDCKKCNITFSSASTLIRHRKSKHNKQQPICQICGALHSTRAELRNHIMEHKDGVPLVCDICEKGFKNKYALRVHMKGHDKMVNENAYCVECNMQFKNELTYKNHLKQNVKHRNSEILKYDCPECKKKFYCKTTLARHLNKHYSIMTFSCNICIKSFIRRDQLSKHMMYFHEGVARPKDKMCPHCNRGFHRQQTLLNHIRTHTGEKPFACEHCSSSFAQKTSLQTHVKTVHLRIPKKMKISNR